MAFVYLQEVQAAFSRAHQHEVRHFSRPYAAVAFGVCVCVLYVWCLCCCSFLIFLMYSWSYCVLALSLFMLYSLSVDVSLSLCYVCARLDHQMDTIRRQYLDSNSPKYLEKLNTNLTDIHSIMCQNIEEVLKRGEKLEGNIYLVDAALLLFFLLLLCIHFILFADYC